MPPADLLFAFAAATAVFALMPGPAILYTAAQTMARGRAGGLMAMLGIHLGGYVHVAAAAFGLSAVFSHVPELYFALKLLGALYLVWLGIGIARGRLDMDTLPHISDRSAHRAFAQSVCVEVLNPKTAVFFLAFLPQFVDPAAALPVWGQLLLLGTIVNLAFSAADLATILLTSAVLGALRRSARIQRMLRALAGSLLVGLGAHLALSRQ